MSACAENLLRHLVRSGRDVTLVSQYGGDDAGRTVYGGGPPPSDRVPDGVEVVALEARGEQVSPARFEDDVDEMTRTVLELHDEEPFDVLHAQYAYPNGLAVLRAARTAGLPAVVSVQGGDGHWVGTCCGTHRELIRAVFTHAPALLIGSPSFGAEVAQRHGIDPARFTLVPGATDAERFAPVDRASIARIGDPVVLLHHGRIDARKGVLDLLDAVRLLRADGVRVRLRGHQDPVVVRSHAVAHPDDVGRDHRQPRGHRLQDGVGEPLGVGTCLRHPDTGHPGPAGREVLPLPEAPHRGYDAAALFAGVRPDDDVAGPLAAALAPLLRGADLVLAPQVIGDHADHRVVVEVTARSATAPTWW